MDVLVLGGKRFIGRAIVAALSEDHDVTALRRNSGGEPGKESRVLRADRTVPEELATVLTSPYDAIVDVSGTELEQVVTTFPYLRLREGAPYVFISSASVYDRGSVTAPSRESDPIGGHQVWGSYGRAKSDCEAFLRSRIDGQLTILRPPYVYGPDNHERRETFLWARMLADRPIFVPGDGTTRIQFSFVETMASVAKLAGESVLPPGTYNIGEDASYSFDEYLDLLGSTVARRTNAAYVRDSSVPAREYFPFRRADLLLDVSAQTAVLGFADRPLCQGLQATYEWFRGSQALRYVPTRRERSWT